MIAAYEFGGIEIAMSISIVLLILISAFFAMAETSLTKMTRIRAGALAEDGRRGAKALQRLVDSPDQWLNALLFLLLVCHLTIGFMVPYLLEEPFGAWGILVGIVAEAVVIFVASELVPKNFAVKNGDRSALAVAPVISAIVRFPLIRLMQRGLVLIANALVKGRIGEPTTSEQELLAMADAALDEDVIEKDERSMIHSIIEFGDTVVREVMKPRPDMMTVDASQSVDEAMDIAIKAGFSRIPVIRDSKDDIAGIVYAKDLMRAQRDGKQNQPVAAIIRPAHFCPSPSGSAR